MNHDGDHQIFFYLIGDGKQQTSHRLGEGHAAACQMGQYKKYGADNQCRRKTPGSEKSVYESPEKDFFSEGPDNNSDKYKKYNLMFLIGGLQWGLEELKLLVLMLKN